jgi:hypothetical protein
MTASLEGRRAGVRRVHRVFAMAVGLGLAAAMTVSLAGNPASGAFVGTTDASGNSVGSAASFCTSPQTVAAPLTADTWVNQGQANVNYGTHNALHVRSQTSANRRVLLKLDVPTVPGGCALTDATLRPYNSSGIAARTIAVLRLDHAIAWTETGVTWANQPAEVAGAVTGPVVVGAWQSWTVTPLVSAIGAGAVDNGFVVRDAAEDSLSGISNNYDSRDTGSGRIAELSVTRG